MSTVTVIRQTPQDNGKLDYQRIESARINRQFQLQMWAEYDKLMNETSDKPQNKNSFLSVQFTDHCVLLESALRGDIKEVEELLSRGVDPNSANVDGLTALHQACIDNDHELCQLLINYGADVNAKDADLWTPLHAAATCGYLQICKILLRNGADVKSVNTDSMLPFDICEDEVTLNYLQDQMQIQGITQEDIDDARFQPEAKMLVDLKKAKSERININALDSQGAAPIHIAAACGYQEVGRYLLMNGVDPNSLDKDGWTASHISACWGELDMIRLFVTYGADLTIQTTDGRTVFAICDTPDTHDEVCKIWNMRETLRAEAKSTDSCNSARPLRRRRSSSSVNRSSMRNKNDLSRREAKEEAKYAHVAKQVHDTNSNDEEQLFTDQPIIRYSPNSKNGAPYSAPNNYKAVELTMDRPLNGDHRTDGNVIQQKHFINTKQIDNGHLPNIDPRGNNQQVVLVKPTMYDLERLRNSENVTRVSQLGNMQVRENPRTSIVQEILEHNPRGLPGRCINEHLHYSNSDSTSYETSSDKCCRRCTIL